MSLSSSEPAPTSPEPLGFGILIVFFGLVLGEKVWNALHAWLLFHANQVEIIAWLLGPFLIICAFIALWNIYLLKYYYQESITSFDEAAVELGSNEKGKPFFLQERFRTMHAQVIGTTSSGKTESVILPWAIRDIERGNGMLIVDGKSDRSFLDKLYGYIELNGRQNDFKLFSLVDVPRSSLFNPLWAGATEEIAERVFSSFTFESEYYKGIQYRLFQATLCLIGLASIPRNIANVINALVDIEFLEILLVEYGYHQDVKPLRQFAELKADKRWEMTSGLLTSLGHFNGSSHSLLFNGQGPSIDFEEALGKNHIIYFQLPTMLYPFLGEATGKLALQCFQSAIAKRHTSDQSKATMRFFACFLDDFQDYIYPGFGSLLNKSRSANVGVVFAHQSLGDLDKVSPAFRNIVTTNTNIKVVMRTMDPDTCEYFAKTFGTKTATKLTRRSQRGLIGKQETGDESIRDVEEYRFHPNAIKNLALGEGIITIPHPRGVKMAKLRFMMRQSLSRPVIIPLVQKHPYAPPLPPMKPTKQRTIKLGEKILKKEIK